MGRKEGKEKNALEGQEAVVSTKYFKYIYSAESLLL